MTVYGEPAVIAKAKAARRQRLYGKVQPVSIMVPIVSKITEWTRIGDAWFVPSKTDKREKIHTIKMEHGEFSCTCIAFITGSQCSHCARAIAEIVEGYWKAGRRAISRKEKEEES